MNDNFAIFICTHGRPNAQHTYKKLKSSGYTGKLYLVLDDQDETIQEYFDNFGESNIYVFNKNHYINTTDTYSVCAPTKCVIYSRNAVEDIAHSLHLDSYVVADDDINSLRYRGIRDGKLISREINHNMNSVIDACNNYVLEHNIVSASFGCPCNYFGGKDAYIKNIESSRVPHNFIFRNCKFQFYWEGAFLEDCVTALVRGQRGELWMSLLPVQLSNPCLGSNKGGMYETYRKLSPITKCMYPKISVPSAISIYNKGVDWSPGILKTKSVPKLISNHYKKEIV